MKYYCSDCSYRGNTGGQSGECPACGSYNLTLRQRPQEQAPPPRWRLVVLIGLWAYLIALIIWKLVH